MFGGEDSSREDYVQFRLLSAPMAATLRKRITGIEQRIEDLQSRLAREASIRALEERNLFSVWECIRDQAHQELKRVSRQLWLEELGLGPDGRTVRLVARLEDGRARLVLSIDCCSIPLVDIIEPSVDAQQDSRLFRVRLDSLAAEGCLVELVNACSHRLGVSLAKRRRSGRVSLSSQTVQCYLRQRSAWLLREFDQETAQRVDPDELARQLNAAYWELVILDNQLEHELSKTENHAESRRARFSGEYDILMNLPLLKSLRITGEVVKMETNTVYIRGINVGDFQVTYDWRRPSFCGPSMRIVNTTRPVKSAERTFDHPHVRDSQACLGNIRKHVAELMARRELPLLIPLTLEFLQSYNPANPHCKLERFGRG
jgi:hypothetical protein